jgi:predicted O-methyltransferase YrrM
MSAALIARSFLPFAARFLYRHPTKLGLLRRHWSDYVGRSGKLAELTGVDVHRIDAVLYELECEEPLFREVNGLAGMPMHPIIYYALVRVMQPDLVVETGVCDGFSTRFLLLAMERNGRGTLHSIDLPNQDVELAPEGSRQRDVMATGRETGWLVPASLRSRWQLHLGDAKVLLPALLPKLGPIDAFIHDSLHTYEHMLLEYRAAWPHLRAGGILLSDDTDWNTAFPEFTALVQCSRIMFNFRVGAIRKPLAAAKSL